MALTDEQRHRVEALRAKPAPISTLERAFLRALLFYWAPTPADTAAITDALRERQVPA